MKRTYSKPEIMFESFTLSTNIAGDCERIVGIPSKGTCGVPGSDGENLFSATVTGPQGCAFDWESKFGDNYDGFCYHNPSDVDKNLFNS